MISCRRDHTPTSLISDQTATDGLLNHSFGIPVENISMHEVVLAQTMNVDDGQSRVVQKFQWKISAR